MQAYARSGDSQNNPWLDLVRALAILLVMLRHGERALHTETGSPQGFLQMIFMNGWIGVDLFFVLSGYLIARHLIRAGIGRGEFRLGRYIAMRALRIFPAYYAVLLLTAAGAFPLVQVSTDALGLRVAYHLLFLQDYLPSDINVVFWSLGVEEKFYVLAPLLILTLLHCRNVHSRLAVLLSLFALPIALRAAIFLPAARVFDYPEFWRIFRSPFHMALEGLIVGVGIALAEHAGLVRRARVAGLAVLACSILALTIWTGSHEFMAEIGLADAVFQPPLIAFLAGMVTLGGVLLAGTPMPFSAPVQLVARLSYSLYLIHYPLLPMAVAVALPYGSGAFWIFFFAVSLLGGGILHLAIERPFLRWKDRLAHKRSPTGEPAIDRPAKAAG
ncbi:acyltransferase family protein [Sinorhizobium chiapasense]|uniref:Acyltransferase n=1 Tax=Sinorhizobium chiapasense TaxID=501572 RepID=A0ABZ2B713_9HYPH